MRRRANSLAPRIFAAACALGLMAPPAAAAGFRVIYNASGPYAIPTAIVQFSPSTFFWDSDGYRILSVTKSGAVTLLAAAPNNQFVSQPAVGSDNRAYNGMLNKSGPPYVIAYAEKSNTVTQYPGQTLLPLLAGALPNGTLLGHGGDNSGAEHISMTDTQGNVASLYQFGPNQVSMPPIYASDGNYYGVAYNQYQPNQNVAYVYRVTPSGAFTKLIDLPNLVGAYDIPAFFQGSDGNLYGVTNLPSSLAGSNAVFYRLTLSGQYTQIYAFPDKGPSTQPGAAFQASDGNFYGITNGNPNPTSVGTIYKLTPSGQYTTLMTMKGTAGTCACQLFQGNDGKLYGSAINGGKYGLGTIFEYDLGLPPPAPRALSFQPASGPPGTKVMIWGYNLLEASVQFNGVAAKAVHSSGPQYVWATVPRGATSGAITATTPSGKTTTVASFAVSTAGTATGDGVR